ncbi:hypothetical protein RhiirA4_469262 [Rhizophagus irregularis]|uniref:Uncharacterized protein n=1 Tax=Rhizophagus irregularis TaxID=588596 RepID=A0A2I1GZ72_9GLOM|nr:hypothetical protein RhiirA4_469262 [Rhizophagus irregularis]
MLQQLNTRIRDRQFIILSKSQSLEIIGASYNVPIILEQGDNRVEIEDGFAVIEEEKNEPFKLLEAAKRFFQSGKGVMFVWNVPVEIYNVNNEKSFDLWNKFLAILIFLFSIPAAVRADDDENEDFYFYLADILCSISSMCVCSRVICTRVDADKRSIINFSINLISVISSVFGLILGRGRTIKAAVQGLITIILWILPSILMLLDHNNEKFEVGNEILTSHINFLNITRLYLFSGAGREMLTYIEISKIVSSLLEQMILPLDSY